MFWVAYICNNVLSSNHKRSTHFHLFYFICHSCLFASLLLFCSSFIHFHHLLLLIYFHCLLPLFICLCRLLTFIAPSLPSLAASPLAIVVVCVPCFHHLLLLVVALSWLVVAFATCYFIIALLLGTGCLFALFVVLSFILLFEL